MSTSRFPTESAEQQRSPLAELIALGLPAIVTMTSYTLMQFVDLWIVSKIGPEAVAGVGNGGIIAFMVIGVFFGLVSVISTFVSQNLGAGTPEHGAAYAWNGLYIAATGWLVIMLPVVLFFEPILVGIRELTQAVGLQSDDSNAAEIFRYQLEYGRIMILGGVFTVAARAMAQFFYGLHKPQIVMVISVSANLINVPISYALVLGVWGMPELGVAGAAIGTAIASAIEVTIPLLIFLSPKYARDFGTRREWRPCLPVVRDISRIGWPQALMMGNEILCWWIFMDMLVGRFGAAASAAGWIVLRYMHLSFMPAVGLSIAMTIVVGKLIGQGRRDLVQDRTRLGVLVTGLYMGIWAAIFVIFREPLIAPFAGSAGSDSGVSAEAIIDIGAKLMIVAATFQVFDAIAIAISGSLRGAGDTVWPGAATVLLSWTCIVGMGYATIRFFPDWGPLGPWAAAAVYIFLLATAFGWRYLSGAWKKIDLLHRGPGSELPLIDDPTDPPVRAEDSSLEPERDPA
ncbi:MAG: MATE family efflux transporter [Planctomycetota bacterium]